MLDRLDRWNDKRHWLPEADQWFPAGVFWGVFVWNFPILVIAIAVIGAALYRADPDPSGLGVFTSLNWAVELAIGALGLGTIVDSAACLWMRHVWNRRARALRKVDALENEDLDA